MPSFQNFSVTAGDVVQVNAQEYLLAGQVQDDQGQVIADYTGPNVLHAHFGGVFTTLSAEQMFVLLTDLELATTVLAMRAGVR